MIPTDRFEQVEVASADALWAWLAAHHARAEGVWLVTWKRHVPARHVGTGDILDALVAWGWTDGLRRKLDADRTMQLISPRRQQVWAASNRDRAARLIAEGRMAAPGLAAIEAAKAAGLWEAEAAVDALIVPPDLAAALGAADFGRYPPAYRRNVLRWLHRAVRPGTRAARIARIVETTVAGTRIPQM